MDLWTIVKAMVRRFYVTVPFLLLTGALSIAAVHRIVPTYQSVGSVLFVQPNVAAPGTEATFKKGNPYLVFSGSLTIAANALARVVTNEDQRDALVRQGLLGDYDVRAEESFPGVTFIVNGPDPGVVSRTSVALVKSLEDNLAEFQDRAGAPSDQRIEVEILSSPSRAVKQPAKKGRLVATVVAVGAAVTVGFTLLADAALTNRRRRRLERRQRRAEVAASAPPVGSDTGAAAEIEAAADGPASGPVDDSTDDPEPALDTAKAERDEAGPTEPAGGEEAGPSPRPRRAAAGLAGEGDVAGTTAPPSAARRRRSRRSAAGTSEAGEVGELPEAPAAGEPRAVRPVHALD